MVYPRLVGLRARGVRTFFLLLGAVMTDEVVRAHHNATGGRGRGWRSGECYALLELLLSSASR
jgi:hypothetical protein